MIISFEERSNKFIFKTEWGTADGNIVMGLPDRRFRKASKTWAAPALRRNIEYMRQHINNTTMYTPEALAVYNKPIDVIKTGEYFPAWYKFGKFGPMTHQMICMDKAYGADEYAILFEQGLGKTFTAINLGTAWRMENKIDAVIVICPSSIKLIWEEELKIHCPIDYQAYAMMAGKYNKATAFIEARQDFPWLMVGVEALSQGKAHEYLKKFLLTRRCLIIIDESSRIKTPNKLRTDRCIAFGKNATKKLILSGTSVTQGIEDLYTQFKFLNPNIIGYDSFITFKNQYCITVGMEVGYNNWGQPIIVQKIVGYKNEDELIANITPFTSRAEKKDWLPELPDKIYQNRYITMNPAQKKAYNTMKDELYLELNDVEYEVKTVLEQTLRLQQITGGHYPWDDGEKIKPVAFKGKNPKVTELLNIMNETRGKVVIWCQFRCEVEAVAVALKKAEIPTVQFHGGCDEMEKRFAIQSFRKDPDTKVFLATRAAAYGLTLIEASTAIYFSQGYSLEDYDQSQDRIHRIGQTDPCNYIHLVCDKTIDTKVISALRDKKSLATMVYDSIKARDV